MLQAISVPKRSPVQSVLKMKRAPASIVQNPSEKRFPPNLRYTPPKRAREESRAYEERGVRCTSEEKEMRRPYEEKEIRRPYEKDSNHDVEEDMEVEKPTMTGFTSAKSQYIIDQQKKHGKNYNPSQDP